MLETVKITDLIHQLMRDDDFCKLDSRGFFSVWRPSRHVVPLPCWKNVTALLGMSLPH